MRAIFAEVHFQAQRAPQKIAIKTDAGAKVTYGELIELVDRKVQNFRRLVGNRTVRVAFLMRESIDLVACVLACNKLGWTIIPMNPALQVNQISSLLQAVDANLLIADKPLHHAIRESDLDIAIHTAEELSEPCDLSIEAAGIRINSLQYDEFLVTLSSGSTGNPKPIIFSEITKIQRSREAAKIYGVSENDVVLCASPFYHSLGQRLTFLPLLHGATLVQLSSFTAKKWSQTIIENGVTFTIPVSSHLHELVDYLLQSPFPYSSLRCLVSSSAAISSEIKRALFSSLPCDFHEMYGASEVGTATNLNRQQASRKIESVGLVCPGVDIRIVDDALADCDYGCTGQIAVRTPLVSSGYYKLPRVAAESFYKEYFLTGDLGYLDNEGYLYFVDRKKDVIISGGVNIYPSDVESVINESDEVKSCAVIGIKDTYLGEVPIAIVVIKAGKEHSDSNIRSRVNARLAPFQRPLKYFFKESLPLTPSGKVDKPSLRHEFNDLGLDLTAKMRALRKSGIG